MPALTIRTFLALSLLSACAAPDGDADTDATSDATAGTTAPADPSTGTTGTTGADAPTTGDGTTGVPVDPYACVETMRMPQGPLQGPGYDPEMGLLPPLQDTYVVHSTQILLKPDKLERFGELVEAVSAQLMQAEGLVALTTASDPNCGFARTLGIWRSEEAMYKFVLSGAHATAMEESAEISVTGKVTHWTVEADALPVDWDDAIEHLAQVSPSGVYN